MSRLLSGLTRIEVVPRQIYLLFGDEAGDSHGLSFWNKNRRVVGFFETGLGGLQRLRLGRLAEGRGSLVETPEEAFDTICEGLAG